MRHPRNRQGFTIIELLIVVIVIGILAAAGLAKYQNFAETSRRKNCLGQLHSIETGMAVWETNNQAFAENAKCAFSFSPRTGKLTDTAMTGVTYPATTAGTIASISDSGGQFTIGGPQAFLNNANSGPLGSVIRDDNIWLCPSALSRYYGGEKQNIPDDYLDTTGGGVSPVHGGASIGLGGRYAMCVCGRGNSNAGSVPLGNNAFPPGWITQGAVTAVNQTAPCPQTPFKVALCLNYGSFGNTAGGTANIPGTAATNAGGSVGPDGSSLNRHSSRW